MALEPAVGAVQPVAVAAVAARQYQPPKSRYQYIKARQAPLVGLCAFNRSRGQLPGDALC